MRKFKVRAEGGFRQFACEFEGRAWSSHFKKGFWHTRPGYEATIAILTVFFAAKVESSQSVSESLGQKTRSSETALTENFMLSRHCAGDAWGTPFL